MRQLAGWKLVREELGETSGSPRECQVLVDDLRVADQYVSRLLGWQFRAMPPPGRGLLLVPCRAVHTFWMRFPLHVLFLDRQGYVAAVREQLAPWRVIRGGATAHAVLELPAAGGPLLVHPGDRLRLESESVGRECHAPPPSIQFLIH